MNISEFQQNRARFPQENLTPYQGRWVAFSGDGRSILAGGDSIAQLEDALAVHGIDAQGVFFERIAAPEDDIILGGGDFR